MAAATNSTMRERSVPAARCTVRLMQHRTLEETAAVARAHAQLQGLAIAVDQQRHLHPGLAQRPYASEQTGQIAHGGAGDAEHDVARPEVCALRRTAAGETQDGNVAADLGGVDAEPGARRAVGAADAQQVV